MDIFLKISPIIVGLIVDVIIFMFCLILLATTLFHWKGIEAKLENKRSKRTFWLCFVIIAAIMLIISFTIETPGEHLCKFLVSIMN